VCRDAEKAVQDRKTDISSQNSETEKPKEPQKENDIKSLVKDSRSNSTEQVSQSKELSRSNSIDERIEAKNLEIKKINQASRSASVEDQNFRRSSQSLQDKLETNRVSAQISRIEKRYSRSSSDDDRPIVEVRGSREVKSAEKNRSGTDLNRSGTDLSRSGTDLNRSSAELNRSAEKNRVSAEVNRVNAEVNKVNAEIKRIERSFSRSNSADEKRVQELGVRKEERRKEDKRLSQSVEIRPVTPQSKEQEWSPPKPPAPLPPQQVVVVAVNERALDGLVADSVVLVEPNSLAASTPAGLVTKRHEVGGWTAVKC
ncbi:Collagen triple helix repeat protein, partial [Operophtera brumata]